MPFSTADPNAFLAVGMQSGLGSPQVTPSKFRFLKYLSSTLDVDESVTDLREGGDGLDYGFTYKVKQVIRGSLVLNARPEAAGQLLSIIIGGATWNGASAPAIHTYQTGHASFPWFTLLGQHPASQIPWMVSDAKFLGVTIEGAAGQPWKFTLPFTGITHGASFAAVTPTYYGDDPFLFQSNPTYVIDGVADSDITGFKITYALGVDELQSQAITLDELPVMNRDIDVEIDRRFENPGLWEKIYYGASGNIVPTTSVATGSFRAVSAYGNASTMRSLDLNLQLLSYRGNALTGIDPDGKTVTETITAKALHGASVALFAVLNNAHASSYLS